VSATDCDHDFSFVGALQVYETGSLSGVVDLFVCHKCGSTDVIVKKPGSTNAVTFGFDPTPPGYKRFILTCRLQGKLVWQVVSIKPPCVFSHHCRLIDRVSSLDVKADLRVLSDSPVEHELIPVEENVNRAVKLS